MRSKQFPEGIVRQVDPVTGAGLGAPLALFGLRKMYGTLGLTDDAFVAWQNRNGVASLGRDESDNLLIPDFPVWSKVAWMHVDPVKLSGFEVHQLVRECEQGAAMASDNEVSARFQTIGALAAEADANSTELEFGHA